MFRGANLILSGAYDDFTANWYVDVGQTLQIIIILNAMLTGETYSFGLQYGWHGVI